MIDFPVFFQLGGIDVAIVPVEMLKALSQGSQESWEEVVHYLNDGGTVLDTMLEAGGLRSPIFYDREVALFIIARMKTMRQVEICHACRARFGAERAPTLSALNRFFMRVRKTRRDLLANRTSSKSL